jgi:hypothetical protein
MLSIKFGGICPARTPNKPYRKRQAKAASGSSEQKSFYGELANEPDVRGSQSSANRDSRLRLSALTNSRLETFTNPISARSPAPLKSAISVGRISPRIASEAESHLRFDRGSIADIPLQSVARSTIFSKAVATEIPS